MRTAFKKRDLDRSLRAGDVTVAIDMVDGTAYIQESAASPPYLHLFPVEGSRRDGAARVAGLSKMSPTLFDLLKVLVDYCPAIREYRLQFTASDAPFESDMRVVDFLGEWQTSSRQELFLYLGTAETVSTNHPGGNLLHVHPGAAAAYANAQNYGVADACVYRIKIGDRSSLYPDPSLWNVVADPTVDLSLEIGAVLLEGPVGRANIVDTWKLQDGHWSRERSKTPATELGITAGWSPHPQTGIVMFDDPKTSIPPVVEDAIEAIATGLERSHSPDEWVATQFDGKEPKHQVAFLRVVYELAKQPRSADLRSPTLNRDHAQEAWREYKHRHGGVPAPTVDTPPPPPSYQRSPFGPPSDRREGLFSRYPGGAPSPARPDFNPYRGPRGQQPPPRPPSQRHPAVAAATVDPSPSSVDTMVLYPVASETPPTVRCAGATLIIPVIEYEDGSLVVFNDDGQDFPIEVDRGWLWIPDVERREPEPIAIRAPDIHSDVVLQVLASDGLILQRSSQGWRILSTASGQAINTPHRSGFRR